MAVPGIAVGRHLDLDLPETRRHAAAVANGNLVVDHLGQAHARGVDQADATPQRREPGDRHELGLAHVRADDGDRRLGRLLGAALESQLVALEQVAGLLSRPAASARA